ncbi:MAG: hypothetical protein ACXV3F_00585, partial [Frankiaceae bacterium]
VAVERMARRAAGAAGDPGGGGAGEGEVAVGGEGTTGQDAAGQGATGQDAAGRSARTPAVAVGDPAVDPDPSEAGPPVYAALAASQDPWPTAVTVPTNRVFAEALDIAEAACGIDAEVAGGSSSPRRGRRARRR